MRIDVLIFLLIVGPQLILCESLYDRLGVSSSATKKEIRKAYRQKAKLCHPDKNKDEGADKLFKDLTFAYDCLSDDTKRQKYDSMGEEGCSSGDQGQASSHPFGSFFSSMFGGGPDPRDEEGKTGADVLVDLPVSLEEIYNGEYIEFLRCKSVKKSLPGTRKCNCHMEMRTQAVGPGRYQMIQQQVCSECPNFQYVIEDRNLEVEIEMGMRDGQIHTFPSEGEPHSDGDPGDLKFVIRQKSHPIFHRQGDDLYTNVTISLVDALIGFNFELTHLDGHKVQIKRDQITWPGAMLRVVNEGMPNFEQNSKKGALFLTFDVIFPHSRALTGEEKEMVRGLFGRKETDATTSEKPSAPVTYGIPKLKPEWLGMGLTNPTMYNGFISSGMSTIHLSNSIR